MTLVAIPATGVTAIVGPSGAGTSTPLLRLANRLELPTSGTITYGGGLAAALPRRKGDAE